MEYQVSYVPIRVKPECIDAFKEVAQVNVAASRREPGVVRFELMQSKEDPASFMLLEVFKTPDDQKKHWETEHFKAFKSRMPDLWQEPYKGHPYSFVSTAL